MENNSANNMSLYQKWLKVNGLYPNFQSAEYFGVPYSVEQEISMMDAYARSFLQFNDSEENTVTFCVVANPSVFEHFMGLNKMGIKANIVSDTVLASNPSEYLDSTNSSTLVILDVFLLRNIALIGEIAKTNVKNVVIASFTDGIPKMEATAPIFKSFDDKMGPKEVIYQKLKEGFNRLNPNINVFNHDEYFLEGLKSHQQITTVYKKNATALNLYTGGSTGIPKGVEITNEGIINQGNKYPEMGIHVMRGDRNGIFIPPNHPTSFVHSMLIPSFYGSTQVYQSVYNKLTFASDLEKLKLNISMAAPSHYYTLLKTKFSDDAFKHLKGAYTGGEAVPSSLWRQVSKALRQGGSQSDLINCYGMSELLGMAMFNRFTPGLENKAGIPNPGVEVRIRDRVTGEILEGNDVKGLLEVKTNNPMKCYFNKPELTKEVYTEDGFMITKDIATRDSEGYYDVRGRADDSYIENDNKLVELNEIELYSYEIASDVAVEVEAIGLSIEGKNEKIPVLHIVLQEEWENNVAKAIMTIYERFLQNNSSSLLPDTVRVPRGIKVRTIFGTNPISAKRDIASLKQERDEFYRLNENGELVEVAFLENGTEIVKVVQQSDIEFSENEVTKVLSIKFKR